MCSSLAAVFMHTSTDGKSFTAASTRCGGQAQGGRDQFCSPLAHEMQAASVHFISILRKQCACTRTRSHESGGWHLRAKHTVRKAAVRAEGMPLLQIQDPKYKRPCPATLGHPHHPRTARKRLFSCSPAAMRSHLQQARITHASGFVRCVRGYLCVEGTGWYKCWDSA